MWTDKETCNNKDRCIVGKFEVTCKTCGKQYQQPTHSLLAYGLKMPSCMHCGSNNIHIRSITKVVRNNQNKPEFVVA